MGGWGSQGLPRRAEVWGSLSQCKGQLQLDKTREAQSAPLGLCVSRECGPLAPGRESPGAGQRPEGARGPRPSSEKAKRPAKGVAAARPLRTYAHFYARALHGEPLCSAHPDKRMACAGRGYDRTPPKARPSRPPLVWMGQLYSSRTQSTPDPGPRLASLLS